MTNSTIDKIEETKYITSSFQAQYKGQQIGYFASADDAQVAIDARRESDKEAELKFNAWIRGETDSTF